MRNLGEIAHPEMKISLFAWNGKFLVKFEQGLCEQTYKFEQLEVDGGESEVRSRLNEVFCKKVLTVFRTMHEHRISFLDDA